ncbi:MAG: hypothetical protein ABIO46_00515 [Chitinophagales bacterium]
MNSIIHIHFCVNDPDTIGMTFPALPGRSSTELHDLPNSREQFNFDLN